MPNLGSFLSMVTNIISSVENGKKKQMGDYCRLKSATLVALVLSLCFIGVYEAAAQTDQAESKLQAANTAIERAFGGVLAAGKAGGNVTGLLVQLNSAEGLLAEAENSYRTGDSSAAASQADSVLPIAQGVATAAQNLRQTAAVSSQNNFLSLTALTVVALFFFVLDLFLVWVLFKRGYVKNLLKAKPEVNRR